MKKRRFLTISLALGIMASATFFVACDNKEKNVNEETKISPNEQMTNKNEYKYNPDETVFLIDDKPIKANEVMWYIYSMENEFKEDVKKYREEKGDSFYDAVANDKGETVREAVRNEIEDMIYYYEIMSKLAESMDEYNIEDESFFIEQAKEYMKTVSDEDIEKYHLDENVYAQILRKWSLTDIYYNDVIKMYDVDGEKLVKESLSKEQIEGLSQEEYDNKVAEYDASYRQQLFNEEYENVQKNHIMENLEIWSSIPIGD